MSKRMIKVGISCDDHINAKQVFQTFSETQIFELCIPIIYGYSTVLSHYNKVKNYIRVTDIHHPSESVKDNLNIININDKSAIGKTTIKNNTVARKSLYRGLSDLKEGEIDAFVVSSTSTDSIRQIESELSDEKSLPILINDYFRIAEIVDFTSADALAKKIKILHSVLLHDFMVTFPRIAVLSKNSQTETVTTAIQTAFQKGIFCFGVFDVDFFFNSDIYKKFDAALIADRMIVNFTFQSIQSVSNETNAIFISNIPYIVTIANADSLLIPSIYLAIDVYRNRPRNT